jgi:hypothetical protein
MKTADEKEVVRWTNENREFLQREYYRFMEKTHVQLPFDTFCIQAFDQLPTTALEETS